MTPFKTMKCMCIKDGYMRSGAQFCHKGRVYTYTIYESDIHKPSLPYNVETDTDSYSHSMGSEFFNKYFIPTAEFFLNEELFEI